MNHVIIRRVEPDASAAVIVASRLVAELGGHYHVSRGMTADQLVVGGAMRREELLARVADLLAEGRFNGWRLELGSGG